MDLNRPNNSSQQEDQLVGSYRISHEIGNGSFAKVYKGIAIVSIDLCPRTAFAFFGKDIGVEKQLGYISILQLPSVLAASHTPGRPLAKLFTP